MSGSIQFDLRELEGLNRRIGALAHLDKHGLMDAVGQEVESQTATRIAAHGPDPEGEPWKEWSEGYEARRPDKGGLLVLEGDLLSSIAREVLDSGDAVDVGSPLTYAAIHQFGGTADMPPGPAAIPARPYLGLSDENRDRLTSVINDWLDQHIARTLH